MEISTAGQTPQGPATEGVARALSLYLEIVYNCEGGQESVRRERPA